jgi:hypothetical protein
MIKSRSEKSSRIEIDLLGAEGNAYYLLGLASQLSKKLDYDAPKIKSEMMASDYENLIKVFDSYFGDYVTLYR